MSEEQFNQDADIQNDTAITQDVDTEQINDSEESTQDSSQEGQEGALNQEGDTTEPEKIKIGDKEYLPAELEEITKQVEAQKVEAEKNVYQPRELELIETDLSNVSKSLEADATLLQKTFLAKANDLVNEEGEVTYSAQQLYEHGLQTGQWDYFIETLSPADAVAFQSERMKLVNDYKGKLEYLNTEKTYIESQKAKQEDLSKWDSFIESDKTMTVAEKHMFNYVKKNFDFDDAGCKAFQAELRHAIALEQNKADLKAENDSAKQAMMNTSIGGGSPQGGTKIFTAEEIGKMSAKEFSKHEKEIDRQYAKGLIK